MSSGKTPWSKLQREVYKILDDRIDLQIHCRAYRMPKSQSTNPQIPRYWITLGKEIIFDFPKDFGTDEKHQLYLHIPAISQLIRDYIDCPVAGLVAHQFEDPYGITDLLKAADRRIGKRQRAMLPQTELVLEILAARSGMKKSER